MLHFNNIINFNKILLDLSNRGVYNVVEKNYYFHTLDFKLTTISVDLRQKTVYLH